MTPQQRCSQALKDFFTHAQIPIEDRQAYIDQAREVSAQYGADYCSAWLAAWADEVRQARAVWMQARADALARICANAAQRPHPPSGCEKGNGVAA